MHREVLLGVMIVLAVSIAFFRPFVGLLSYLWFSFARPGDYVWRAYRFDYLIFVAGACLLGYVLFEMNRSPIRLKGMTPLLLLWGWLGLASVLALDVSLSYPKLSEYSRGFIMAFVTASMANSEKRVRQILCVLAISLGMLGTKGAVDALLTGFSSTVVGPGGMVREQNEFALALNMGIVILVWLAYAESRDWVRWAFRAMAVASAISVVGTRSRSGLLGLLMAGLIFTLYSKRKVLASIVVVVGVAALLVIGPKAALERYSTIPTATESDASAISRLKAWKVAIQMTRDHPVFGVGLRNFIVSYPQYSNEEPRVTHNVVFEMISETGIPGGLLFVSMILIMVTRMFLLGRRAQRSPETKHLGIYCQTITATLIVYLVPNMFINRQDFDLMYQLLAVGAGLAAVTQRQLTAQRAEVK